MAHPNKNYVNRKNIKNSLVGILIPFSVLSLSQLAIAQVKTGSPQPLRYSEACSKDENIEITAVGDILLHDPQQKQAAYQQTQFLSLWKNMIPIFSQADVAYANLEGPVAENLNKFGKIVSQNKEIRYDNDAYTSYPQFNYHPALIANIIQSGIDVVSTANNHSLDRRALGIDLTIGELKKNNLNYTGTRTQADSQNSDYDWATYTIAKGHKIAWLACTFSTNGIPDKNNQVLPCFQNTQFLLNKVSQLANDPSISAVIVTPHWGDEYQLSPNAGQVKLGRMLIESGATAVLGTHPHVVQPWEKYTTKNGREGLIVYSSGNFVSGQMHIARQTSMMVRLHLTGQPQSKLKIRGVKYLPLYMTRSPRADQIMPVLNMSQFPSEAQKIWSDAYHDENRVKSLQESDVQSLCQ